ncbi:hypothetical protein CUU66_03965 [Peribacillus deserti]|uniref:Uncharacterized protein n=1 Tax=Peribacillus deserti TaxID=673318 RepID=A0A2N5MA34_9BACI|nr:hypothetical protein CUU66_03965 [Peribacillus deserti]
MPNSINNILGKTNMYRKKNEKCLMCITDCLKVKKMDFIYSNEVFRAAGISAVEKSVDEIL